MVSLNGEELKSGSLNCNVTWWLTMLTFECKEVHWRGEVDVGSTNWIQALEMIQSGRDDGR